MHPEPTLTIKVLQNSDVANLVEEQLQIGGLRSRQDLEGEHSVVVVEGREECGVLDLPHQDDERVHAVGGRDGNGSFAGGGRLGGAHGDGDSGQGENRPGFHADSVDDGDKEFLRGS